MQALRPPSSRPLKAHYVTTKICQTRDGGQPQVRRRGAHRGPLSPPGRSGGTRSPSSCTLRKPAPLGELARDEPILRAADCSRNARGSCAPSRSPGPRRYRSPARRSARQNRNSGPRGTGSRNHAANRQLARPQWSGSGARSRNVFFGIHLHQVVESSSCPPSSPQMPPTPQRRSATREALRPRPRSYGREIRLDPLDREEVGCEQPAARVKSPSLSRPAGRWPSCHRT